MNSGSWLCRWLREDAAVSESESPAMLKDKTIRMKVLCADELLFLFIVFRTPDLVDAGKMFFQGRVQGSAIFLKHDF